MFELTPLLDPRLKEPLYLQLYAELKSEIRAGRLPSGCKLPSQRSLAAHLSVSRNTVDAAYQQLLAEGYLYSEPKRGMFAAEMPDDLRSSQKEKTIRQTHEHSEASAAVCDFRYGDIDLSHFPFKRWRTFFARSLSPENAHLLLYGEPQGEITLRSQIAEYVYQSRGVRCRPEQIVIGAGTPYLLSMLHRLLGEKCLYAIEDPGYWRARLVLEESGQAAIPVPLDEHGIRMDLLASSGAEAVYVTPSHQFPLGMIMPVPRRLELIRWAREKGGIIIEDDYDSEFRYEGRTIPSLHSLDPYGHTVYLGTFSKSLMPSARMGYMILPERLLAVYRANQSLFKQTVSRVDQHTLALFMESGEWGRHLNRMRQLYKKRYLSLTEAIRQEMGGQARVIGSPAGLHLVLEIYGGITEKELIDAARREGIVVYPVSTFCAGEPEEGRTRILLGFAGLDETTIRTGIARLSKVLSHYSAWAENGLEAIR